MAGSDTSSSPTDSTVSVEFVLDESVQLGFGEAAKFSSHAERYAFLVLQAFTTACIVDGSIQ